MLKNHLTVALGSLRRHKGIAAINLLALAEPYTVVLSDSFARTLFGALRLSTAR